MEKLIVFTRKTLLLLGAGIIVGTLVFYGVQSLIQHYEGEAKSSPRTQR